MLAHVRPGGDRSTEKFHRLCRILVRDWDLAINGGEEGKDDHKLHSVFILGTIVAGSEAGLLLPPVSALYDDLIFSFCPPAGWTKGTCLTDSLRFRLDKIENGSSPIWDCSMKRPRPATRIARTS